MDDDRSSQTIQAHRTQSSGQDGSASAAHNGGEKAKASRVEPRRLKGFRDFLPDAMETRLAVMDVIRHEAQVHGFHSIATPALEYAQTLLGIGEETDKQSYRFTDHGGRHVGLRFDLTVPFARFVAEHQGALHFPFKKLQMGEVWRGENTQKGRYREFAQCDLDIIGTESPLADTEILALFGRILDRLAFGAFTIGVSSRTLLSGLIGHFFGERLPHVPSSLETRDKGLESQVLVAIDKLGKIGHQGVSRILVNDLGLDASRSEEFLKLLSQKNPQGASDMAPLKELFAAHGPILQEIEKLELIVARAQRAMAPLPEQASHGKIRIDLSIARGLGYYTGVVFESTIDALPGFGSICSGGRYDDLVKRFIDRDLPGIGGSIGLDRLVAALEELGIRLGSQYKPFFVAVASEDAWDYGFDLVCELRRRGLPCSLGFAPKMTAQLKQADRLGSAWVLVVGGDELKSQTVSLKNMKDGVQKTGIPRGTIVSTLQQMMV